MKTTLGVTLAALILAATASAAGPPVAWTKKDMTAAVRAIGYPKPHMRKLACKGVGPADSAGGHTTFRCTATYRHHRRSRFYVGGRGEGGWLCAAKRLAGCKLLRHGFVTSAQIVTLQSLGAAADLAARGYLTNRDETYQVVHFCEQTSSSAFACPFTVNDSSVTVTVSFKRAKGGYVISASTA